MSDEKLEATIDLTINSKDFTEKNVIHQKEFKKVETLIKDQIPTELGEITKGNDFEGYYKSILVEGARGTGKTTFLKNFAKENIMKKSFLDIEILSFLDPTRIEEKSSIFLTIISLIKKVVCDKFDSEKNNCGIECKRKSWNDNLIQLSKGLPSIDDSPKVPHYWDDDFMIMEKGLSATDVSFNLRNNFKKLVKESLQILEKKAFLLIVDDVDTDCKKAWNLLETLRKYLCIQGFITIVSGNLELFSLVVRQEQAKRFKELSSVKKENQILELTDQYIRKVFPPIYRISLGKLTYVAYKKVSDDKTAISVKYDSTADETTLINYITTILNKIGIVNKYQAKAYKDFILSLPLRSQIDFYRVFKIFVIENSNNVTLSFDEITNLFIEDLIQHAIDDDLLCERPYTINSVILKFLIKDYEGSNSLANYYQLQPITLDKSSNGVLFTLGMLLSTHIITNPEMIFNYMIKIGLVRNVAHIVEKENKEGYPFSLNDMVRHCSLADDIDLRQIMCIMTAYLRSATERVPGIFEISYNDKKKLFGAKNGNYIENYIARLPYSFSRGSRKLKNCYGYSIHTLLSTLFDMIRAMETGEDFGNILKKNAQPREYLMVSSISDARENEEDEAEDYVFKSMDNDSVVKFSEALNRWVVLIKNIKKYIQPYVIAKICTRMYYAYSNVKLKESRAIAGIMQEHILLMFNSVIIEEVAENNKSVIDRENEIEVFYKNMDVVNEISVEDIPLCKIFLTCPLFLFFVNFSDENKKKNVLADFCEKVISDFDITFYEKNAYTILKKLDIKVKNVSSKKRSTIPKSKPANSSDKTGSRKVAKNEMSKNAPKEDDAGGNKPTGANGADGSVDVGENTTVQAEGTASDSNLINENGASEVNKGDDRI